MLHITNPLIKHKVRLLNLAKQLSDVSKACKVMHVSRDTFYRYQETVGQGGVETLVNKDRKIPNIENRVEPQIE